MSKRLVVYPYKMGSGSASRICEEVRALGFRAMKVYPDRLYRPRVNDVIINWGCSTPAPWGSLGINYFNWPSRVALASNKLSALQTFTEHEVPTLVYTTDWEVAQEWLDEGNKVVERHRLQGHSGEGIVICDTDKEVNGRGLNTDAPLYTKYFKRAAEYRIHVFNGAVIDWQQKLRRRDYDGEVDNEVRNHSGGWVYARDAATRPNERVLEAAIAACTALGLDFGAVDVAWNDYHSQAAIFEVNTAPGLFGTTLQNYVSAIVPLLEKEL